jgi:predicted metallopeptidase
MYEVSEAQGTFVVKPPYKIYLDEEMIRAGGPDAVNVVIHELLHFSFSQYHLKEKEEETIVNSYGNFLTELLCHSALKEWIRFHTK